MKYENANGKTGCLIWCADDNYRIRIYNDDLTFNDYDIKHSDLFFKITDGDAFLYEDELGNKFIDYGEVDDRCPKCGEIDSGTSCGVIIDGDYDDTI